MSNGNELDDLILDCFLALGFCLDDAEWLALNNPKACQCY